MAARKPIFFLIIGFIGGIVISSFWNLDFGIAFFFIFLALVLTFLSLTANVRDNKTMLISAVLFLGFGLGILRYEIKDYRNYNLENLAGKEIAFKGIITDEPDERENHARLIVKTRDIACQKDAECPSQKILIYSRLYPKFQYGDLISIKGRLAKPEKISGVQNDNLKNRLPSADGLTGNEFDWPAYLAKDDIFYEMFYPDIAFISGGNGNWLKSRLFSLKEKFLNNLTKVIPEPAASFLGGITVGAKKSIPKDLQNDFIATGIIHIVVLSGYNIAIIARSVMLFFEIFTPRFFAAILGGFGIILFAIMTGGSATVVRASIMAMLALLAKNIGRIYHITIALFAAGLLMILHNPKILRFDTSFQLSFLSTLGLIYLAPLFEKIRIFKPTDKKSKTDAKTKIFDVKTKISETFAGTLSAQLAVTPLLLYTTGNLSVVALPVNLLILLFIPATMFFGFLTGAAGFLSEILSIPFSWITYGFLAYELWVVKIFSHLPFADVQIPYFPAIAAVLIYGIMTALILSFKKIRASSYF